MKPIILQKHFPKIANILQRSFQNLVTLSTQCFVTLKVECFQQDVLATFPLDLKLFYQNFTEYVRERMIDTALKTKYRNNMPIIYLVILSISIPLIVYMSGRASESLSQSSLLCTRQGPMPLNSFLSLPVLPDQAIFQRNLRNLFLKIA